jgi:hypothetical protein
VNTAQKEYFSEEISPGAGFDYNCSGNPDRDPSQPTKACGLLNCTLDFGYLQADLPPCGKEGSWGTCTGTGALCSADVRGVVKAKCH